MIAIVDYDTGNLHSVKTALHRLGAEWTLTADPAVITAADRVLLPGVGNASEAMARLRERGLDTVIRNLRRPVLGICVGMQVMCRRTDEGGASCMGIFDTDVTRFPDGAGRKVPQIGWNTIANLEGRLFRDVPAGSYVYYVHSYHAGLCIDTCATTRFGEGGDALMYSAALRYENFHGVQFHPEKSGAVGARILDNFLRL